MTTSTHTRAYQVVIGILKDTRKAARLTQQDIADRLNKPQSYVAKVEGGERRIDFFEFIAMARALEKDPKILFSLILQQIDRIEPAGLAGPIGGGAIP